MRCRLASVLVLAIPLGLAGCGGGGGEKHRAATTSPSTEPPTAREPLAAAAKRLEQALPRRDCNELIRLMIHSIQRGGVKPDAPPSKSDCAYIRSEERSELRGYRFTKAREWGTAGFSEGDGRANRPGYVIGILWLLDSDGSWKAAYEATYRPQLDPPPRLTAQADANVQRLVSAIKAGSCADMWRLLNVASRFVRASDGRRERWCRELAATFRKPDSAFAQIKADPAPSVDTLGRTRDFHFYALRLHNRRYMDVVLSGPLANVAPGELRQHDNPSVLEMVTVRQPR